MSDETKNIESLIKNLGNRDGMVRQRARQALIGMGKQAVPALTAILTDSSKQVRWEAAMALSRVATPEAAPLLTTALEDEDSGIRWVAAEALIRLGKDGLVPLLKALVDHPGSAALHQAAHHVLHDLRNEAFGKEILPVYNALNGPEPETEIPVAASAAMKALS